MTRTRKYLVAIIAIVLVGLAGLVGVTEWRWQQYANVAREYNQVAQKLELDALVVESKQWWDLSARWSLINSAQPQLGQLPQLQQQVAEVEAEYARQWEQLREWADDYVSSYPQLESELMALAEVEFAAKRHPFTTMQPVYQQFRTAYRENPIDRWRYLVDYELASMDLAEKLGQLVMLAPSGGLDLDQSDRKVFANVGGAILMGRNIDNQQQTSELADQIDRSNPLYPALIATDQEGGLVKRVGWDLTAGPQKARSMSVDHLCDLYEQRSNNLDQAGINVNLGLVADIPSSDSSFVYNRAIGLTTEQAADNVGTAVSCTEHGIQTVKHFPGHGSVSLDTHQQVGVINLDWETWQQQERLSFQAGIDAEVGMVMLGHLVFDPVTGDAPASVSQQAIKFLREEMGHSGLVITDDMDMLRRAGRDPQQDFVQALMAEVDQVLYVSKPLSWSQMLQLTEQAIVDEKLSIEEIDQQVKRVLEFKQTQLLVN